VSKPRIAIVGCGYWGQNLIRNFADIQEVEVKAVCDCDRTALARMKRRFPSVELKSDYDDVITDTRIDAVVVATPVSTHYPFARKALLAGKHVLVEKPLATSSAQALDLIELSHRQKRTLMVDHTFLYTGAVRYMKSLIAAGGIGDLLYFDSVRTSLGLVQSDINVLWDLGPHDLSILDFLCARDPVSVSATGMKHMGCPFEDIAYVSAQFEDNFIAHFHLNWLAPVKVRTTLIGGSKKMIIYNDMESGEKIKVCDKSVAVTHNAEHREKVLSAYRNGDMLVPNLDTTEALHLMASEFAAAIIERRRPISDGESGYRVVRLLEAAQWSLTHNGRPVELGRAASALLPERASDGVQPRSAASA
jgi:predicted dehydrogenase